MFNDFKSRFPLGLTGWQESLLTLLISFALFGWDMTFFSVSFVGKGRGRILGGQEAASSYPLLLRQQSFEKDYCWLCRDIVTDNVRIQIR